MNTKTNNTNKVNQKTNLTKTNLAKTNKNRALNAQRPKKVHLSRGIIGLIIGLIWIAPFYLMLTNSFKTKPGIFKNVLSLPIFSGTGKTFTAGNYAESYKDLNFTQTFFNSLLITVISTVIIIFFSSLAAYALQRCKFKVSSVVFMVFTAAMLVPFQSIMLPLVSIWGKAELLNRLGIVIMYLGFGSSLSIFLYFGAIKGIPKALDEASTIDGASKIKTFFFVIFPMLTPTTVTVAVLNVMWIWNDYLLPSLVINKPTTQTIPLSMFYFFGQYTKQWHLAMAGLTIAIIPIIIFYFVMQKRVIKGVADGAVK
jgi:raffinose/stachyose/melibiose transport system permease protein